LWSVCNVDGDAVVVYTKCVVLRYLLKRLVTHSRNNQVVSSLSIDLRHWNTMEKRRKDSSIWDSCRQSHLKLMTLHVSLERKESKDGSDLRKKERRPCVGCRENENDFTCQESREKGETISNLTCCSYIDIKMMKKSQFT